jgi:AcrR family transcriptional regulator
VLSNYCYALPMNASQTARSLRERVRGELTSEIKALAREQLATEGTNLSLRAIARDLGMASSAIYRYFPSRDDLLTALIIDCYNELGAAAEDADTGIARDELLARWLAYAHAIRDWALRHPAEYALIYGSPVPGYRAPQDTVGPAARNTAPLLSLLADGAAAGRLSDSLPEEMVAAGWPALPDAARAELDRLARRFSPAIPAGLLSRGVTAWVQLFGLISFELFGRFQNMIENDRRVVFDHQIRSMAALIGLR